MTRRIVAVIALVLTAAPAAADSLFLDLAGSPGLRVKGTCRLVDAAGQSRDTTLDGRVPYRFEMDAVAASCAVDKMDERGLLRASLSFADRVVVLIETSVSFGSVTVRSDGPWGPALASRTTALWRRDHRLGAPGSGSGTTSTVPPLGGTSVPPLRGTTVPPLK
jgi:hypothetical protein